MRGYVLVTAVPIERSKGLIEVTCGMAEALLNQMGNSLDLCGHVGDLPVVKLDLTPLVERPISVRALDAPIYLRPRSYWTLPSLIEAYDIWLLGL